MSVGFASICPLPPQTAADTSDGQAPAVVERLAPRGASSDAVSGLSPSGTTQPSADSPSGKGGSTSRDSGCYASSEHLKKLSSRQHEGASPAGTAGPAKYVFFCFFWGGRGAGFLHFFSLSSSYLLACLFVSLPLPSLHPLFPPPTHPCICFLKDEYLNHLPLPHPYRTLRLFST